MKRIILLELCLLFLATTFQGDRLTGWVQQTIPRQDLPVMDLQFLDSLAGFMVQSRYTPDSSFISKTIDGGNNWTVTQIPNSFLTAIQFVDKLTGYCVGSINTENGVVMKTTNSGINWFTVSLVGSYIYLEDVMFANKDTGWVCSAAPLSGGLWRTTNGGLNWQLQMDWNNRPSKIFFINNNTGWVIGNSNSNLYKTTNSGVNWFLQASFSLYDVFFTTADTGWVIGGNGNGIMRTTNSGDNWYNVNNPVLASETRLYFINNTAGWGGSVFHKIYCTKDGINWGTQYSPSNRSDNINFVDSLHGWAGYTGLVHTTDGGGTIVHVNSISLEIPKEFELGQNYPNPFNNSTIINYQLSRSAQSNGSSTSFVQIKVFDISGKEIATLVNDRINAGKHSVSFNASTLSSGIYFYQLSINNEQAAIKKMMLIK